MAPPDRDNQPTPKRPAKPPVDPPAPDPQLTLFPLDGPEPACDVETRAKAQPISMPLLDPEDEPGAPLLHDPWPDQFTKIPRAIEQKYGPKLKDTKAWKIAEVMHDMLYGWRARGRKDPDQRSYEEISRATNIPLRTVKRKVPKLIKVGLLEVAFRGGYRRGASRYRMPFVSALPRLDRPPKSPAEFRPANQGAKMAPCEPGEGASPELDQGAKMAPWKSNESAGMAPAQGAILAPSLERGEVEQPSSSSNNRGQSAASAADPSDSILPSVAGIACRRYPGLRTNRAKLAELLDEFTQRRVLAREVRRGDERHGERLKEENPRAPLLWAKQLCDVIEDERSPQAQRVAQPTQPDQSIQQPQPKSPWPCHCGPGYELVSKVSDDDGRVTYKLRCPQCRCEMVKRSAGR